MTEIIARRLEKDNQWREAQKMWASINREEDERACKMIADSIKKGNAYRKEVEETIGEEPVLSSTTIKQWEQWHEDLRLIYNKHYRQ